MEKSIITYKQILKQLKADLIGKDSYRGVTFTYSWLANQFGHFSLGYIPTLICFSIIKRYTCLQSPALTAALLVSILWVLFELYNFLGPLLLNKQSNSKAIYIPSKQKYTFQPAWWNIAFDTFTDLLFFWFGAFSASLFLVYDNRAVTILLVLGLVILYPSYYWFLTKMYLQYAKFPIQFRLSQWKRPSDDPLDESDIQNVQNYISVSKNTNGNHLLIFGGRRSGKSTLSIGIGAELSIKRCSCSYYTATKIFNLFSLTNSQIIKAEDCDVWSWRSASLLIIDDINPGKPLSKAFLTPDDIYAIVSTPVSGNAEINKEEIRNKNVIWVVGDEDSNNFGHWESMLLKIGVPKENLYSIGLGFAMF